MHNGRSFKGPRPMREVCRQIVKNESGKRFGIPRTPYGEPVIPGTATYGPEINMTVAYFE